MNRNQFEFSGRLGQKPELKTGKTGVDFCEISIAVNRMKKKGEEKAETDWFYVTLFGKTASYLATYAKPGDYVIVTGRVQTDNYEKDGKKVYGFKFLANELELIQKKDGQTGTPTVAAQTVPAASALDPVDDSDIPF